MFIEAGDSQHALEQFKRAMQLNSNSVAAFEGAGKASFDLAAYVTARRFLDAAVANGDMNLIYRMESATNEICLESSNLERARLLVARKHGVAEQ